MADEGEGDTAVYVRSVRGAHVAYFWVCKVTTCPAGQATGQGAESPLAEECEAHESARRSYADHRAAHHGG
jgi:hypothetical protein